MRSFIAPILGILGQPQFRKKLLKPDEPGEGVTKFDWKSGKKNAELALVNNDLRTALRFRRGRIFHINYISG